MEFIIFFLILLVPGLIAAITYSIILNCKSEFNVLNALIFDLFIFIINITGLYYFKGIATIQALLVYFDCMSFTRKYALLSILIGLILALIFGFIRKWVFWFRKAC